MDHPSGVTEHDKVVELTSKVAAISCCRTASLASLLDEIANDAKELQCIATTQESFAILFVASIVRKPSEKRLEKKWRKLSSKHSDLIGSTELEEACTLIIDALGSLILKRILPEKAAPTLLRLNEIQNLTPA